MKLHEIFRIQPGSRVAVIGSGGKTSTLIRLGESFERNVVLTTTTHVDVRPFLRTTSHSIVRSVEEYRKAVKHIETDQVLITGEAHDEIRFHGPPEEVLAEMYADNLKRGTTILIEADGSRMLPLKAPKAGEPVIPEWCNHVIVSAGMSGIGATLTTEHVHRMEIYSELSGLKPGDIITPEAASRVLTHPLGGLKGIPSHAERTLLLNQAEDDLSQAQAGKMAGQALKNGYGRVIIASLGRKLPEWKVYSRVEPVAGVLLAAGGSTRMGQPKQLLVVDGQPLVRRMAEQALLAGLDPLVVVVGSDADQVEAALAGLAVKIVHNPDWQMGQSTSVLAGLKALPMRTGAVEYLLTDQPYVQSELMRALAERWYTSFAAIVAPLIAGTRANPVLFDRSTFDEFATLTGDRGAKTLLQKFKVDYLPWQDERVLLDLDTMDDYVKFQQH